MIPAEPALPSVAICIRLSLGSKDPRKKHFVLEFQEHFLLGPKDSICEGYSWLLT